MQLTCAVHASLTKHSAVNARQTALNTQHSSDSVRKRVTWRRPPQLRSEKAPTMASALTLLEARTYSYPQAFAERHIRGDVLKAIRQLCVTRALRQNRKTGSRDAVQARSAPAVTSCACANFRLKATTSQAAHERAARTSYSRCAQRRSHYAVRVNLACWT